MIEAYVNFGGELVEKIDLPSKEQKIPENAYATVIGYGDTQGRE